MGKHPLLPRCIQALLDQAYPGDFRVLVVDNATDSGLAAAVVAEFDDPRLELVSQPIPGLSFARNAAIAAATAAGAQLLLFTDDDAIADPGWLVAKAAVFGQDPGVSAVTGLIVPGSLASAAEQLFEEGSGFNKGYQRRVWSAAGAGASVWALGEKGDGGVLFPFAAGSFGSGNSLGFRTHVLTELGGFDTALGAGTLTAGGEDLDIFVRVIIAGGTIVYEPKAMVRHYHRETYAELQRQMVGYGSGLSAFLFRELLREPAARKQLLRVVPAGLRRMFDKSSEKNESRTSEYPKELARAEQIGFLKGPWLYLKATRRAKKMAAGDRG
jgi:glycosyltransferase involved in cell wall biosynthesis